MANYDGFKVARNWERKLNRKKQVQTLNSKNMKLGNSLKTENPNCQAAQRRRIQIANGSLTKNNGLVL